MEQAVFATNAVVTATFNEAMDPATIDSSTVELRDDADNPVPATVSYDDPSRTVSITPLATLAENTEFTALLRGGTTDPRVKDISGNALAADSTWSFTTAVQSTASSLWDDSVTPEVENAARSGSHRGRGEVPV